MLFRFRDSHWMDITLTLPSSLLIPCRDTVSSICSTSSRRCATIHTRLPEPRRNSLTMAASRCVLPVPVGICTITFR